MINPSFHSVSGSAQLGEKKSLLAEEREKRKLRGVKQIRQYGDKRQPVFAVLRNERPRKLAVNVFVSKAAPVETQVIPCDPTLSPRTYFASFQRPRLLFHTRHPIFPCTFPFFRSGKCRIVPSTYTRRRIFISSRKICCNQIHAKRITNITIAASVLASYTRKY